MIIALKDNDILRFNISRKNFTIIFKNNKPFKIYIAKSTNSAFDVIICY